VHPNVIEWLPFLLRHDLVLWLGNHVVLAWAKGEG
jgi:hypothetical protein